MDLSAVTGLFTNISIATFSVDWIVAAGVLIFLTFDALRAGLARVTALAIALPIALFLSSLAPQTALLQSTLAKESTAIEAGVLIALIVMLFILFYRIADTGFDSSHPLSAAMAGFACTIVLMVTLVHLPLEIVPWTMGESFRVVFSSSYALFWMLGSYLLLAAARR